MFRVQWRAPEKALGILEMWVTFGCHLCNIHGYSGMVSALCILISDLPLVKLSVIVGWLEKSIILWFIVVTRVGKVQFVSRKLKMNSSVKIQCIPSSGVAVAKATGTDLGEQWNGLLTQLSWLFSDHGLVLEEDGIADHLQRVRHLLWQVSTPNRRYWTEYRTVSQSCQVTWKPIQLVGGEAWVPIPTYHIPSSPVPPQTSLLLE